MKERISDYYSLTKPGVLYGNVLTSVAGFLLAAGYFNHFRLGLFVATIVGMTLVIAGACVLNNVLDQDIDSIMDRTKARAVASGKVPPLNATIFSACLSLLGFLTLAFWVNWLVFAIAMTGFVIYVWLYGVLGKRRSVHGTIVGSVSGAMPILAGYCALSDRIDVAAVLLFLALFFWQFPEFYSIAIYRRDEYKAAGIPVISIVKGTEQTKKQILIYTIAFVICTLLLSSFDYTGWVYFVIMASLGFYFIDMALKGQRTKDANAWARKMFHASLIVLLAFCLMLSIGSLLP